MMMKRFDTMKTFGILAVCLLGMTGCTTTQKGAAVGGVGGATLGGIIGHQSGHGVAGAAIGGALGTAGGMLIGDRLEKKFCPEGGEVYTEDVNFCPNHGVELKYRNE